ncbi:DMT family transporter [Candidatus Regiella insecticola]|uniref:Threonine/homoserine exporter RhtA n=1 Tax=Candidatus Regiella insecticola TaxID=138073 RepID=A0A6L2ZPH0_9ENTR|nr:DMT family transporter [Candidatus Regiella insecticola]GFN46161.1 eamA/RhaT family transporter [Candidatus Regiella insecticola]
MVAACALYLFAKNKIKAEYRQAVKNIVPIFILAFLGLFVSNYLIYLSLHSASAMNVAIINSSLPAIVVLVGLMLRIQKTNKKELAGVFISTIGVLVICTEGHLMLVTTVCQEQGNLIALLCNLSWALYIILLKKLKPTNMGSVSFLFYCAVATVIISSPFMFMQFIKNDMMTLNIINISAVLTTGLGVSVLAYLCYNFSIEKLGSNKASSFMHMIPVVTIILAFFFLEEEIKLFHIVGIVLVFFGVRTVLGNQKNA